MIKIKPKNFILGLIQEKEFEIYCDCCNSLTKAGGHILSNGTIVQLYGDRDTEVICNTCFNKGLSNFRHEDYKNHAGLIHSTPQRSRERSCALCNQSLLNNSYDIKEINLSQKFVCLTCAYKSHPDDKHSYFPNTSWGVCSKCGTLRTDEHNGRKYWSRMDEQPSSTIPKCIENPISKYRCNHQFIFIKDFTKNISLVEKMSKREISKFSAPGELVTRADFIYETCGYKLFWCKKCGEIERELPSWYSRFL